MYNILYFTSAIYILYILYIYIIYILEIEKQQIHNKTYCQGYAYCK